MDIEQPQNEILEARKAGLGDGFDGGYTLGYRAAMVQVYMDIEALIHSKGDMKRFKGLLDKVSAAITKKAAKRSSTVFTRTKQQFMRDEGL